MVVWFGRSRQLEFFDSNMNVSINDIKEIGAQHDILLNEEQIHNVLSEYNRIVMDKAESWDELINHLIINLKEQNK